MKTRKLLVLVSLAALLLALAGCSKAAETRANPVTVQQTVEVTRVVEKAIVVTATPEPQREEAQVTDTSDATTGTTSGASDLVCRLDKVATAYEVGKPPTPQRMEVFGGGTQHVDFYPSKGVKSISYLLPSIPPPGVPEYWFGFGSIWEGAVPQCDSFDWIADATAYAQARLDSGHSGIVVDFRGTVPEVVANVANLSDAEIAELGAQHAAGQTGQQPEVEAPPAPMAKPAVQPTPKPAGTCPDPVRKDRVPVVGEAWQPCPMGYVCILNGWTNEPTPAGWETADWQKEHKLLLVGSHPNLLMGGAVWLWNDTEVCRVVVEKEFGKNPLPGVMLADLRNWGLVK